jgi:flavin-binding protein dodecin
MRRNEASDPKRAATSIEGVSRTSADQAVDSAIARSACSITAVTGAVVGAIGVQR